MLVEHGSFWKTWTVEINVQILAYFFMVSKTTKTNHVYKKSILEICERYTQLPAEDMYEIDCAPSLGKL